jgi:NAD(P)H-hydrate epimerase
MTSFHLSRDQVRELDRRAIHEYGVPGAVLMENASRGAAELLARLLSPPPRFGEGAGGRGRVLILCGPGNNGGDGFVMARHLQNAGFDVDVWLIAPLPKPTYVDAHPILSPDAFTNYRIWFNSHGSLTVVDTAGQEGLPSGWTDELTHGRGWIIDAMFGTGLTRALATPYDEVAARVNSSGRPVLAVDIPSGLDCDTGKPLGPAIRATHTATFVALKKGFLNPEAAAWIGEVHILDIGAPKTLVDEYRTRKH